MLTHLLQLKPILLLVLFTAVPHTLSGQESDKENEVILSLSPLALADIFDGASLRGGAEVSLNKTYAVAIEGGVYLPYLKATKIDPKGFLIRPSVKKYLKGKKGKFIALEYMYKKQDFDFRDSIVIAADRFEKQYNIKRQVHSLVFKYGKLVSLSKKLTLEWHCGIGVRYNRSHSNLTDAEEEGILTGEAGDCPIQEDIIRLTGTKIFPDFRGGIKIGYRI